ncbi:unnamed protein product [Cuscuta europaea]|uniref:Wall-associated receptor kinase galacturonan-binding domain-containing protein n=1 Tax=Cuscuta europaea TaxID=41803 RepID=A0A9P1E4Y4_CUSEU|nr:unnamed protein product [Cuscuta europaea]
MGLLFYFSLIYVVLFQAALLLAMDMAATISDGSHTAAFTCRSYCGNLSIDYPFGVRPGCGHPGYRELLFCINDVLMFHVKSGSYRVLNIDYAYKTLTLDDPHMSTCSAIVLGGRGNGFTVEPWRATYLQPTTDNVFMLLGCSAESSLFQGFRRGKNFPCRNVSGMGCEDYYECPAWNNVIGLPPAKKRMWPAYAGPPECCAVSFGTMKAINLTELDCQGYSSAYSLAPLRLQGADAWSYGIRVRFSIHGDEVFCKSCQATGGICGYAAAAAGKYTNACMCGSWNSTSHCDSPAAAFHSGSTRRTWRFMDTLAGFLVCTILLRIPNIARNVAWFN